MNREDSRKEQAKDAAGELTEPFRNEGISQDRAEELNERWERRLAWPVLIAAIVSVPATFLTLLDEPWEMIGHIGLYATSVVLVAEVLIFFLISPKKIEWVRENKWLIGLTILTIIAVVFSIGPMQILRVVRSVGALRVLRAKQVATAGEKLGKDGRSKWRRIFGKVLATVIVAVFVFIAFVDPDSEARQFIEGFVGEEGATIGAFIAGFLTLGGMYLLVRDPKSKDDEEEESKEGSDSQQESEPSQ
ncbi:hypothetical protein [Nesterenkonia populi]|uniref:hypothetical protein n=1 Tax=Nesterenkonia populi TaxID=1591087 RepID=UPI0011BFB525|nr:hypothetical protein [Nesterenkonia populi]